MRLTRAVPLGLAAGTAGTAAFALSYRLERALRPAHRGALDYDDSEAAGRAVATVLGLHERSPARLRALAQIVRWGYGPMLGIPRALVDDRLAEPWVTIAHAAGTTAVGAIVFPMLAEAPPPWRWPADAIVTSLATHLGYAGTASAVFALSRSRWAVRWAGGRPPGR